MLDLVLGQLQPSDFSSTWNMEMIIFQGLWSCQGRETILMPRFQKGEQRQKGKLWSRMGDKRGIKKGSSFTRIISACSRMPPICAFFFLSSFSFSRLLP